MTKRELLTTHAEAYELDGPRGGWLCKTKQGAWVVLDAAGKQWKGANE